ncbi:unnamed protein product, partial [Timema podura]|nr:unnamed protein product [Timema podura]
INESTVVSNKHSLPDLEKELKGKSETDLSQDVQCLLDQIMQLKKQLLLAIQRSEKPVDIQDLLKMNDLFCTEQNNEHAKCQEEYQKLKQEFEFYRKQTHSKPSNSSLKENGNELVALRSQVKTLKDRISILNAQLSDSEKEC